MMKLGVVGLGRMGGGVARRCAKAGVTVFGYDPHASGEVGAGVTRVATMVELLEAVEVVLLLVPAGDAVDEVLAGIMMNANAGPPLKAGDETFSISPALSEDLGCSSLALSGGLGSNLPVIIDGGNSFYKDTLRRHALLATDGVEFLDAGISGGIHGEKDGFCLMVGGNIATFTAVKPLLEIIAAPEGVVHTGTAGSGHYVKMVHNGIEYGLLQAYAEGTQLLAEGAFPNLDLAAITKTWQHGSVIRSWLGQLLHESVSDAELLKKISGVLHENGTGRWTVHEAKERKVPVEVIKAALDKRAWSRETGGDLSTKIVALLRNKFGGHPVEYLPRLERGTGIKEEQDELHRHQLADQSSDDQLQE